MKTPIRSGASSKRLTALVLSVYGTACWLALPGCTKRATTKDHVIPVDHGGTDAIENLRPACGHCNSTRRNLAIGGTGGIEVTLYIGPASDPLAAAANTAMQTGDILIYRAHIANALTPPGSTPTPAHEHIAGKAFNTAMAQALRMRAQCHIRIVYPTPQPKQVQLWSRLRYRIEPIDPGRAAADQLAHDHGTRQAALDVRHWYERYPSGVASIERIMNYRPTTTNSQTAETLNPSRAW